MAERPQNTRTQAGIEWQYQLRITLAREVAKTVRNDGDGSNIRPLYEILRKHNATLKCQFDLFADYCAEAERTGADKLPLYSWTKATIKNPVKKAKYVKSFTIYIDGKEVYAKEKAEALEADLRPMAVGPIVTGMSKHDTNPASNPQPPKRFRS